MNLMLSDVLAFARHISKKWILWLFALIDVIGLVAQTIFPQIRIPIPIFVFLTFVGFFWAGFQVYRDLVAQLPSRPVPPSPFDVLPRSFEISLSQEIPSIKVWLYVSNHQSRDIVITSLEVTSFNLSGGPSLDSIPYSSDITIPKSRSELIMCKRTLNDYEIRAIKRTQSRAHANASFHAGAQALIGRKRISQTTSQFSSNGRITGL